MILLTTFFSRWRACSGVRDGDGGSAAAAVGVVCVAGERACSLDGFWGSSWADILGEDFEMVRHSFKAF